MKNASLLIHPEELSLSWIDRMAQHGIPTLALHPEGGIFLEYAPINRDHHASLQGNTQSKPLQKLLNFFGKEDIGCFACFLGRITKPSFYVFKGLYFRGIIQLSKHIRKDIP